MIIHNHLKKLLLSLFFITGTLQAQISANYEATPLKQVLESISTSYDLIFSFSDDVVKDKKVTIAVTDAPIEDVLELLKASTGLDFRKISDRQIIISAPDRKTAICGYVYDDTGTVLPYASVSIENTSKGTVTNDEGFFQLESVDKDASVIIQYIGYKDRMVAVSSFAESDCPKLSLSPESTALQEVVVVEYVTTGIDKNKDGSFTISNEDQGILPGQTEPDIFQSIQLIPGINSPDETATGIQIRGGAQDQNLILWDDIKMYNTGHFFGMLSAFNPYVTKEAKIFKGGADPKYGDRISGVIDISSDKEVPEKFNGGFGFNGTHGDLFLKAPVGDKVAFILSGRRSYTDVLETPTYNAYSEKVFQNTKITSGSEIVSGDEEFEEVLGDNNFFFYDTSARLIMDLTENDKILVSGLYTSNDLSFEIRDEEDVITDELQIQNKGASFSWQGTKRERIHHSLKAYYSNYDSDYRLTERQDIIVEGENTRRNTVEDIGVAIDMTYDINKNNALLLGYHFSNTEVFYSVSFDSEFEDPFTQFDRIKNSINTVYAGYKFFPGSNGLINIGVRASHYSVVDKLYAEPRLNIEYPLTGFLRIKATGELRYQPINQLVEFENTDLRLADNIWVNSNNNDIPVLESTQLSGGLLFSKKGWTVEIDSYYKTIKGLTSFTSGFNTVQEDLSSGESRIFGVDVYLKKRFKGFRTWISYTFNDIDYTFTEIQEASFPGNNDITHNFRFSNTCQIKDWELSLGWLWRSGSPFTDADLVGDEIVYDLLNGERLPNYHRLDASAIYRFALHQKGNWTGQLGISLQNIYNRRVPLAVSYRVDDTDEGEFELNQLKQRSLGITPNLIFRVYF